jgi:hypothetical protein
LIHLVDHGVAARVLEFLPGLVVVNFWKAKMRLECEQSPGAANDDDEEDENATLWG